MTLIVGLGNPGQEYENTRHNAGAWLVERLANQCDETLRPEKKFHGLFAKVFLAGRDVRLLLPTTFMNHSGQAVAAVAKFYKLEAEDIIVAHDELDLPAGSVKLKQGGGHGGHNGLRDIINHLGSKNFVRVRVGIGHPGHKDHVLDYVLGRPSKSDQKAIEQALGNVSAVFSDVVKGNLQSAMTNLHTKEA